MQVANRTLNHKYQRNVLKSMTLRILIVIVAYIACTTSVQLKWPKWSRPLCICCQRENETQHELINVLCTRNRRRTINTSQIPLQHPTLPAAVYSHDEKPALITPCIDFPAFQMTTILAQGSNTSNPLRPSTRSSQRYLSNDHTTNTNSGSNLSDEHQPITFDELGPRAHGDVRLICHQKNDNHTVTTMYWVDYKQVIGSGQYGTVYHAYEKMSNHDCAVKCSIIVPRKASRSDAHHEFMFSKKLAKRQSEYINGTLDNVVRILDTKTNYKKSTAHDHPNSNIKYLIVMDHYPGSLRDIINKQLTIATKNSDLARSGSLPTRRSSSPIRFHPITKKVNISSWDLMRRLNMGSSLLTCGTVASGSWYCESDEIYAMAMAINVLKQCVMGLKQLLQLFPNLQFNDLSPGNILVTDVDFPVSKDIMFKLSDFGKTAVGKFRFGTAPYVSGVEDPQTSETQDINSLAVIGLEVLSAFGSIGNIIWTAIYEVTESAMTAHAVPMLRDARILELVMEVSKKKCKPFQSESVTTFFQQLAQFAIGKDASFDNFERFLNTSMTQKDLMLHMMDHESSIFQALKNLDVST
eukprot:322167_1